MHPKSKLHYIECFCHRHWHMSGPNCISTITSRRIYKKNKGHSFSVLSWPHRGSNSPGGLSNQSAAKFAPSQLLNGSSKVNVLGYHRMHKIESNKSLSSDFRFDQSERSYKQKRRNSPFANAFSLITPKRLRNSQF